MIFTSFIIGFTVTSFSLTILLLLSKIAFSYDLGSSYKMWLFIMSIGCGLTANLFYSAICR